MTNKTKNIIKFSALSACLCLSACGKKKAPQEEIDPAKAALTVVRAALQGYYGDHEGKFPAALDELTKDGKYLAVLPKVKLPGHAESSAVLYVTAPAVNARDLTDAGGYAYYGSDKYPDTKGTLVLNCTHADKKGSPEYLY